MSETSYFVEDLQPGMTASFSKTITETDVVLFAAVSGDTNPVHFDEEYAKTTVFKGRVVHGMLSLSLLSAVLGSKMPGPGTIFLNSNMTFKAPVRIGDRVTATCTVREVNVERKRVVFDCTCAVKDTVVVQGEALVMVPSRGSARA
jgi:3-hydroxybutyryl-CoA dehydratase